MPIKKENGTYVGNFGSAFSDGVRMGELSHPVLTNGRIGLALECRVPYLITPLTAVEDNIFANSEVVDNGFLDLRTDGDNVQTIRSEIFNSVAIELDTARIITFRATSTTSSDVTFTVHGIDISGEKIVHSVVLPLGDNNISTLVSLKYITAIHSNGLSGGTIEIGTNDGVGLPFFVDSYAGLGLPMWNDSYDIYITVADAALPQTINARLKINFLEASSEPATITSSDRRGIYYLPTPSDGAKVLHLSLSCRFFGGNINTVFQPPILNTNTTPWSYINNEIKDAAVFGHPNYDTGWVGWQG